MTGMLLRTPFSSGSGVTRRVAQGPSRCPTLRLSTLSRRSGAVVSASAEPQTSTSATSTPKAPVEYVTDNDFSLSKIAFGSILTPIGLTLMVWGFGAYFTLLPGADLSSLLLIYGFPVSLLGFALNYAKLDPVTCRSTKEALALRDSQMTDIQKQIREDVTRFRYGDEQHLEEALDRIFKPGRPGGVPRKLLPTLVGVREETTDGAYTLVLEFKASLEQDKWQAFQPKLQSFFGPGILANLAKTEQGMDVALVCDGSGAGRGGGEKKDVLPPLMPGLKARQQ